MYAILVVISSNLKTFRTTLQEPPISPPSWPALLQLGFITIRLRDNFAWDNKPWCVTVLRHQMGVVCCKRGRRWCEWHI